MELMFIGADHEVTGSCHYLNVNDYNILVDYGMEQGVNVYENAQLPVDAAMIDFVLLTHAHVDHSGMLPKLYAKGFRGRIFTTYATADLCSIMLRDCAHIQQQEAEWQNRKAKRNGGKEIVPEFTMEDADNTIHMITPVPYGEKVNLCEGVDVCFTDVGHLLGSASIEVWATEGSETRKIVFSGDIGNINQPLIKDPQYTTYADYVVMESTYGDRVHEGSLTEEETIGKLANIIQTTLDKGGNVVIPSFAVGRTQEILYFIRKIKHEGMVKGHDGFPVYVDSPMAVEATNVFQRNVRECFDEDALALVDKGINPIRFPNLKLSISGDESKYINADPEPKVIISASGMCEAGRIRHHLKHNLWRPESTILFVGYQAVGTTGRVIVEGAEEVKLFGETIEVKATIAQLTGLSGHADKNGLLKWAEAFANGPDRVFCVHGDDGSVEALTNTIRSKLGFTADAPYSGTRFDLIKNEYIFEAQPVAANKKRVASDVYSRLEAAGKRLLAVIARNKGGTNKDLAKFADQINSLCDKWDR